MADQGEDESKLMDLALDLESWRLFFAWSEEERNDFYQNNDRQHLIQLLERFRLFADFANQQFEYVQEEGLNAHDDIRTEADIEIGRLITDAKSEIGQLETQLEQARAENEALLVEQSQNLSDAEVGQLLVQARQALPAPEPYIRQPIQVPQSLNEVVTSLQHTLDTMSSVDPATDTDVKTAILKTKAAAAKVVADGGAPYQWKGLRTSLEGKRKTARKHADDHLAKLVGEIQKESGDIVSHRLLVNYYNTAIDTANMIIGSKGEQQQQANREKVRIYSNIHQQRMELKAMQNQQFDQQNALAFQQDGGHELLQ